MQSGLREDSFRGFQFCVSLLLCFGGRLGLLFAVLPYKIDTKHMPPKLELGWMEISAQLFLWWTKDDFARCSSSLPGNSALMYQVIPLVQLYRH
jgi:hypothetical protein